MSTYFVVNRPSNLIIGTVSASYTPQDSKLKLFVLANSKALDAYYKWLKNNPELCPDLGEIAARSDYVADRLITNRKDKLQAPNAVFQTENLNQRYRESRPAPMVDRETEIQNFILRNPDADVYDVADEFLCGTTVARAYLAKYSPT